MFNIIDMDLKLPLSEFTQKIDNLAQEYEDDCGVAVNPIITPATTKNGKQLYKVTLANNSLSGYEFSIYTKQGNNGVVEFTPFIVDGNSCCENLVLDKSQEDSDNDMSTFAKYALTKIFAENKGTIVYKDKGGYAMIKRGSTSTKCFEAVIDGSGNVYSPLGKAISVDPEKFGVMADDDDDSSKASSTGEVEITVLLPNWVKQVPEAMQIMQKTTSQAERMDDIGLLLIEKRLNDELNSKDFKSMFYQAANIFGFSGTNQQIQAMSKLILDDIEI